MVEALALFAGWGVFDCGCCSSLTPLSVLVSRATGEQPSIKIVDWRNGSEGVDTSHASRTVLGQTLHVDLMGDRQCLLYAAPEVRFGHDADGQALDIYSLGAIAYHLFSDLQALLLRIRGDASGRH